MTQEKMRVRRKTVVTMAPAPMRIPMFVMQLSNGGSLFAGGLSDGVEVLDIVGGSESRGKKITRKENP